MSFARLLLHNLLYHRRGNLAVLLGVVVGTTVLTGALLVGDSLRGSLRDLTEAQLGWVDAALISPRFFREELAEKLPAQHASPIILLQTAIARASGNPDEETPIPKTLLLGVGPEFWAGAGASTDAPEVAGMPGTFWAQRDIFLPNQKGVVLSAALARDLKAQVGDKVTFSLERVSTAPRETIMGRREAEEVISKLSFNVKAILPAEHFGSRFNLNPSPGLPRTAYLPLCVLQYELYDQQRQKKAQKRFPKQMINGILVRGGETGALQQHLKQNMQLIDWGLELRQPKRKFTRPAPEYLSLESREMFVPLAAQQAVKQAGLKSAPTLVYLVNNMASLKHEWGTLGLTLMPPGGAEFLRPVLREFAPAQVPYSIVAALDPGLPPPLGPFLPKGVRTLADNEILLVDWEDSPFQDLQAQENKVALTFFDPDQQGQLREQTTIFKLAGHLPLAGATDDLYLTPEFPGITDSSSLTQLDGWDPPFPFKRWLVSDADEDFWALHRATPKAYITLKAGQKLWGSRFGDVTSLRIVPEGKKPNKIEQMILAQLKPEQGGLRFENIRAASLKSSGGSQEFGGLFLGFSSFLIMAALLLIGLLFRLNLDLRAKEIGLLLAVGWRRFQVRLLLLAEGVLITLIGGLIGLLVAVAYARLLLDYLAASWPGGLDRTFFLRLHVTPLSLAIGYGAALLVSVLTIYWATRVLGKIAPSSLLAGQTASNEGLQQRRAGWVSKGLIALGLIGAAICFVFGTQIRDHEMQAGSFLGSGALLLTAGLAAVWVWLHREQPQAVTRGGMAGLARLGLRNAARSPARSLLTMGLLASATFLIVAVQAFHRDPSHDYLEHHGASGGFALLAEAEVPIFEDLNQNQQIQRIGKISGSRNSVGELDFYPFRLKQGDDASCLNLYKPREPRLLGVPASIIQGGGFHFGDSEAETQEEKDNPWLLLDKELPDDVIPVIGEANTVTWMLSSRLGGEVAVTDGAGRPVRLRIVALLRDSVFQSELLMSEKYFRKLYPRIEGFRYFLIGGPKDHLKEVKRTLEKALAEYGVVVTPSRERLETYLAVENTYLATFQALGGLGLLLGALGLAVVLLRGVWERRGELALLRALGFRHTALNWLILAENSGLLILGLLIGTAAALISVAPHLFSGAEVQWLRLAGLLLLVLLAGVIAEFVAVLTTLRAPIVTALRRE